ncbi:MAG TPA: carboxypeptidase-like regulatory domain-containing protein [Planctomycetota bacterium]|nr:carboxypeptidase-like regulatory domain-containing protein [Planctomycetota bacterium]
MSARARLALAGCVLLVAFALLGRWAVVRESATAAAPAPHAMAEAPIGTREALAQPGSEPPERVAMDGADPALAPAEPPAAQLEPELDEALLRVRVVSQESDQPLAGMEVLLRGQDFHAEGTSTPLAHVPRTRARPNEVPRTGDDGWAEFILPQGRRWGVLAVDDESAWLRAPMLTWTPTLAGGQTYEIVLRVADRGDLQFFGRVVAADDRSPLAGAEVELDSSPGSQTQALTGPDGVFELRGSGFARARARGFAPALFHLAEGHERAADAFEVRLQRGATVVARVRKPSGAPIAGAHVTLWTNDMHLVMPETLHLFGMSAVPGHRSWMATTDADGQGSLEDLPPGVPLTLELRLENSPPPAASVLELQPGEMREVDLIAGGGIELRGRLVDQHGDPIADQRIVLLRPEPPFVFQILIGAGTTPLAEARSDAQGRFTIPDVSPGNWMIGPAPAKRSGRPDPGEVRPEAERIVPLAIPIEVGTLSPQEILLRVDRGLYIRGRVVDSEGNPAKGSVLALPNRDPLFRAAFICDVKEGAFLLGPLAAGRYRLTASGSIRDARSDTVLAESGERDVLLRLRVGGRVAGQVVDGSTGLPSSADVSLCPIGEAGMMVSPFTNPEFHFEGLPSGTYALLARSGEEVGWLAGVDLRPGEERTGLRILLQPGAGLRVWNRTARWTAFLVQFDGYWIDASGIESGSQRRAFLPAGHVAVRLHQGEIERTIEVDLVAGEVRDISFEDEQR